MTKLTITERKENALLGRVEVQGNVSFTGATPRNQDIAEAIAKELKTDAGLVVMKKIHTQFSKQEASIVALVYKTKEGRQRMERLTKQMKKELEERKKADAEAKKKAKEEKAQEEAKKKEAEKTESE